VYLLKGSKFRLDLTEESAVGCLAQAIKFSPNPISDMPQAPYKPAIVGLKLLDMLVLSTYYFVIGFFIASAIDWFIGKFDSSDEDKKSTLQLFAEAIFYTFCLVFVFYIVRNVVERIPFPLDGLYGFRHELVKERSGDVVFVFVLFFYQQYYVNKLKYLHTRLQEWFHGMDNSVQKTAATT
jgi:hypothetical protein